MRRGRPIRKLTERPYPLLLPIWPRVIFVDWNGVLCNDVYWSSIATKPNHPFHDRVTESRNWLFGEQRDLVDAWQKGQVSSREVIGRLNIRLDGRCSGDYLLRRLERDCREMKADSTLLNVLATARKESYVVLATDNIDSFFDQLDDKPELQEVLDGVLCSSAIGRLKGKDIVGFFEPWLSEHHLSFRQALLMDDSPKICAAFAAAGGHPLLFQSVSQAADELRSWLATSAMGPA